MTNYSKQALAHEETIARKERLLQNAMRQRDLEQRQRTEAEARAEELDRCWALTQERARIANALTDTPTPPTGEGEDMSHEELMEDRRQAEEDAYGPGATNAGPPAGEGEDKYQRWAKSAEPHWVGYPITSEAEAKKYRAAREVARAIRERTHEGAAGGKPPTPCPRCESLTEDILDIARVLSGGYEGLVVKECSGVEAVRETVRAALANTPKTPACPKCEEVAGSLREAAKVGYMQGHNDTVESQYGDPDEVAADICKELGAALTDTPEPEEG
jgi:hypothetical protein